MEREVSNILLGQTEHADHFRLKWGWFTFYLKIKPITAKQMIQISGEWSQIKNIDQMKEMFPALMEGIIDIKYISKVIAISTGTKFVRVVSHAILKLPLKDIQTLFAIVKKQCDAERFFFIIISAKGMIRTIAKQEQR